MLPAIVFSIGPASLKDVSEEKDVDTPLIVKPELLAQLNDRLKIAQNSEMEVSESGGGIQVVLKSSDDACVSGNSLKQ